MEIPHNNELDVAIYQGGYGSGKTWSGALLGIMLARKYPGCRGLVGAATFTLVERTTLVKYFEHLEALGYESGKRSLPIRNMCRTYHTVLCQFPVSRPACADTGHRRPK